MQVFQYLLSFFRQIDKVTALHRLHYENRFVMLTADLITLTALYRRIIVIHVVKLNLYHLNLRVLGQNLIQYLCPVMERNTHMTDLSFSL